MATLGEIEDALNAAAQAGAPAVGLMQCTSVYPAPVERINLRAMDMLRVAFGVPVGAYRITLRDHGADRRGRARRRVRREAHYARPKHARARTTRLRSSPTSWRAMVRGIREAEAALGDGRKDGPVPEELEENYTLGRRSLIATRDLPAGDGARAGDARP